MTQVKPRPKDRNIVGRKMLRAFAHPVARCCEVLRLFGCCWLKFENGQNFNATFVDVAWCCSRLPRFAQQCCTQACAIFRFSIPNMSQRIETGWSNARNLLRPTMLGYVVLICCDRLAGAWHWISLKLDRVALKLYWISLWISLWLDWISLRSA